MCGPLDVVSSCPSGEVRTGMVLYFNWNPGSSASFSCGSTLTGKLYTSSLTFVPKYRSTSKCQDTRPLSSRSVPLYKLHDIIRSTPGTAFNTLCISRNKLIGLWIELWHADFDFEEAIDGGLNHGEHKLNCRLDVQIFIYSHNRDEILVVLDWMPLVSIMPIKSQCEFYPNSLLFVEAV